MPSIPAGTTCLGEYYSMKAILTLFGIILLCSSAFADDLTLTDGRVLKDATIKSQTPLTVTIKHAAGLSSVAKTLLPPDLQAKYPVDEAAARIANEKNQQARFKARELEKAEYQRSLKVKAEREETAKISTRAPIEEEANRNDRLYTAKREVQSLAEKYFRTEYDLVTKAKNIGSLKVTISDLQLVEGWANRWSVRGKCDIQYNGEVVKVYPTYSPEQIAEVNQLNSRGYGYPQTTLDHTPYETTEYSQKTQDFVAIYNAEAAEPTFEVTLR
jgi:Icc-related predicted phosphoesterase